MPITRRSLNFDFVRDGSSGGQGFLDSLFTFARASTATRFNASGVLESVASGVPRFNFDPATLLCRGLAIEEARTNYCLRSQELENGVWAWINSAVTANQTASPDGSANADKWTRSSTAAAYSYQSFTKPASAITYTWSIFVKKSVGNYFALALIGTYPARAVVTFNLNTGAIETAATGISGFTGVSATIKALASSWYRVTLRATTDAATTITAYYSANSNGVAVDGVDSAANSACFVWGSQLEEGAYATSYIPTTSAAVTRAAEVCYAASVTPWIDPTKGTISVEFDAQIPAAAFDPIPWRMGSGLYQYQTGSGNALLAINGINTVNIASGLATDTVHRYATAVQAGRAAGSVNGSAVVVQNGFNPSTLNMLTLGSYNESFHHINGHIRRFQYLPFVVDDVSLKQMTVA